MGKSLYIAEKPSVAREFAQGTERRYAYFDGYQESENAVITWCVGHLVTMSYPESLRYEVQKMESGDLAVYSGNI